MSSPFLPILTLEEIRQSAATPPVMQSSTSWALKRGPLRSRPDVWALEPKDGYTGSLDGLAGSLAAELGKRPDRPAAIMLGQASDPFLPNLAGDRDMERIVHLLAERRISLWLTTRGPLPAESLQTFAECREHVHVTVAITTLEPEVQRVIEPPGASPADRLRAICDLKNRHIPCDVGLEPLLPGLSDSPDRLRALLDALAELRVASVTAGYLVLRPEWRERLHAALAEVGWDEIVLSAYDDGPLLRDGRDMAQYLHKTKRQRGYALLMSLAAERGITVRVSELSNPDFRRPATEYHHHPRSLLESFRRGTEPALF